MPHKYKEITGYFDFENIYDFISSRFPNGDFVEVGAFLGKSTCFMAECIKEKEHKSRFYAVDTFLGEIGAADQRELAEKSGGTFYELFIENMKKAGVIDFVIPIINNSVNASKTFKEESLDFVFIDSSHIVEDAIDDLNHWFPKIKSGGFIGGHDYYVNPITHQPSEVKKAVQKVFGQEIPANGASFLIQKL